MSMMRIKVRNFKSFGYEEDIKKAKVVQADSSYCEKCGHTQRLWGEEKHICKNCGTMVFKNDEVKFKYRLKEKIIRKKREQNGN